MVMSTNPEQKEEFRPRKLVPIGESILVHYSGKPPKPSTRTYNGEPITEVTFWLGIVDKTYPELVGQYHRFIVRPWISAARVIEAHDDKPRKTISASKLYQTIAAIAGDAKANEFAYHDASLDINAPEYDPDAENFVGEEQRAKAIPPEEWKQFRGFYVAIFKEPRKDKETGQHRLSENGGIFWQEVLELKSLKFARITTKEQLDASIVWPLPRPELGAPKKAPQEDAPSHQPETPPQEPPKAQEPPPFTRTFGEKQEMVDELIAFCTAHADFVKLKDAFLLRKGATKVMKLPEEDIKHLLVLFWLDEHRTNGGTISAAINAELIDRHKQMHELDAAEAIFLLAASDFEAKIQQDDGVPF